MTKRSKKVLWFVRISRFVIVDVWVLGRMMMTKRSKKVLWFARISRFFAIDDCWCCVSRFSRTHGRQLNDDGTYSILDSWLKGRVRAGAKKGHFKIDLIKWRDGEKWRDKASGVTVNPYLPTAQNFEKHHTLFRRCQMIVSWINEYRSPAPGH